MIAFRFPVWGTPPVHGRFREGGRGSHALTALVWILSGTEHEARVVLKGVEHLSNRTGHYGAEFLCGDTRYRSSAKTRDVMADPGAVRQNT